MSQKERIEEYIGGLLQSAETRDTEQGRRVCRFALNALSTASSQIEIASILRSFNRAYLGIEAHGHLTQHEFLMVQELREIQSSLK